MLIFISSSSPLDSISWEKSDDSYGLKDRIYRMTPEIGEDEAFGRLK